MIKRVRSIVSWVYVLSLDGFISVLALVGAFLIRFDGTVPTPYQRFLLLSLPIMIPLRLMLLFLCEVYWSAWRFVSLPDLWRIIKGVALSSAVFGTGLLIFRISGFPRSVLIIDGILALIGIGGIRMLYRMRNEIPSRTQSRQIGAERRLLIVGAGNAGEILLRTLRSQQNHSYVPVGFVDDDRNMLRKQLHGVRVLGTIKDIPWIVKEKNIEEIVVAIPSASGEVMTRIVERCMEAGCKPKIIPDIATILSTGVKKTSLREVEINDLLMREPVELNMEDINACLRNKTILVTGAAGSIGSEICRQVLGYSPLQLILFDQSETDLHFLDLELEKQAKEGQVIPVIGDMTNQRKVEAIMERCHPQVVFHSAAYKHVPLMEMNSEEAIRNNLRGTIVVVNLAVKYGVERLVMLSTDKAVQPTSIMGVSKRLCELFIQAMPKDCKTKLIITRFGNVLGSTGSVVPLFQRQIRQGGPVTVTHADIVRYFMTIPEAVQLVLQAGTQGEGGELYILNMGREVHILELAERLIRLSGMEPYKEIPIKFTGLRPGEKMNEQLWSEREVPKTTAHGNIFVIKSDGFPSKQVHRTLNQILSAAERLDGPSMMRGIHELLPDYQPCLHTKKMVY